ncbi:MAG TPA: rhomboid family intramembrane serine protease [Solirubrobacteraceae bacterium]
MKDNITRERFPSLTVALLALLAIAYVLYPRHTGLAPTLLDALFLALFGPSVEDSLGRVRFGALCLLGGGLALTVHAFLNVGPALLLLGAWGATAAVLGGYLPLHPRARVLTLIVVPFFATLVELPAIALLGVWLVAQVSFGALGLDRR